MLATLRDRLEHDKLFPRNQWVVLAVSGGADSLALLHAAVRLQADFETKLHVATFDHRLRGEEGAADVAFVQGIAAEFGVPCTTGAADVLQVAASQRLGVEAAARAARYAFLADVARQIGARTVATAHHADDQVETVLMHILRGSGVHGLLGMPNSGLMPEHPDLRLVRPLLDVRRAEIDVYCVEHNLVPRHDNTNDDTQYQRNALRQEVLPQLRQYNPQVDEALLRLRDVVLVEQDLVERIFQEDILPGIRFGDRVRLPITKYISWHPALQRRALRAAAQHLGAQPGHQHIVAAQMAVARGTGAQADLTAGILLRVDYDDLVVEASTSKRLRVEQPTIAVGPIVVQIPGETRLGQWTLVAASEASEDTQARLNIPLDAHVQLRKRQPGDRFQPLGLNGQSQKLKKWLIDHKVPQQAREHLPLLIINGSIAALPFLTGWVVAHPFAERGVSQHLIYFHWRYNED